MFKYYCCLFGFVLSPAADWKSVTDLRERFSLADNVTQSMAAFRSKPPSSRGSLTRTNSHISNTVLQTPPKNELTTTDRSAFGLRSSTTSIPQPIQSDSATSSFDTQSVPGLDDRPNRRLPADSKIEPAKLSTRPSLRIFHDAPSGIPKPRNCPHAHTSSLSSRASSRQSSQSDLTGSFGKSPRVSTLSLHELPHPRSSSSSIVQPVGPNQKVTSTRHNSLGTIMFKHPECSEQELLAQIPATVPALATSQTSRRRSLPAPPIPESSNDRENISENLKHEEGSHN
ncbi:hypothetical protein FBUS_10823 [Fasciolopsis buskii]|uniref:Uncharacterized protein n=1 Tax=Fasciolopsis buskii TaxID=27845 RepID=A0A8E0RXE1_9TREM|nr:hypothetical protein FBUS_10823 [Fasciolopsis buski]